MERLGTTEYSLKSTHAPGPLGLRHVVESQSTGEELLADIVSPDEDAYLIALCQNIVATRGLTDHPGVANVREAGALPEARYFQVVEMPPLAHPISNGQRRLSESELWEVAQSLVASLMHLHRRELAHGALSPARIYENRNDVLLGELWHAHTAAGRPLHGELSKHLPHKLPAYALPFMAPEVLLGAPPDREADVFSLGAVLFYLLTGDSPRDLPPPYTDEEARKALAQAAVKPLADLRPDVSEELEGLLLTMLSSTRGDRPTIFLLQAICDEVVADAEKIGGSDSESSAEESPACRPLSSAVSPALKMPNQALAPGKLVRVTNSDARGGVLWLSLSSADDGSDSQYCVRWVLRAGEGTFALVEKPDIYWDSELQDAPQAIVKVLDRARLLTLTTDEFDRILPEVKVDIESRRDWPASRWRSALAKDLSAAFGEVSERAQ